MADSHDSERNPLKPGMWLGFLRGFLPAVFLLLVGVVACSQVAGPQAAGASQRVERQVLVGDMLRTYTAYLPGNVSSRSNWRVMMVFHPALGSAAFMEEATGLHDTPGAEDFIVVYPEGFRRTWNAGSCCGFANRRNVDDVGFFRAIMADLDGIASIRQGAYLTGFSNGALMVYELMCELPDEVAAAAPFAAYLPAETMGRCRDRQVPLLHIHGDADQGAPVEGGMTNYLGFLPPAQRTVEIVARRNGCDTSSVVRQSVPDLGTSCLSFAGCSSNAEAKLCVVPNLGHVWPGMEARGGRFGPARPDLDGSRAVVDFFLLH